MASFAEASPGDPQAGENIFESKCAQRLAIEKGAGHKQGPNGLFGRQTGATADYSYSAANNNMAVILDESSLYDCLLNPKKVIPHERLSSTSQVNAHKQTVQYNEHDIDQPKLQPQSFSTVGRGARRTNRMGAGSLIGSSGSISFPEEKLLMPSSPPRISLRRPVSPPIVRSIDGTPTSIPGRVSISHPGSAYAPGRVGNGNGNGWLDQRRLPNEDPQPLEAYTLYNLHKGYGRKHPRDLIDAYGNPENSSYEKFAKAQRLDGNGTASVAAAGEWRNSDEEEYAWEDMSPTLADRSRGNCIPPFGPNSGSFSVQTGFSSPNPSLMESDFVRHSWPGEAQRRTADGSSHIVEDRIASHGSQARLMMKSLDGPSVHSESLSRRDTGKSTYILRQSTQQNLRSRSQSRVAQMLPATRGLDDNSIDMDPARRGLSNAQADSLKMVTSMMDRNSTQRHPSTPATLPPVHVSQSLSLRTVATQSPIRSLDVSEPNKSTLIQGAHQPIFMPEQQYNVTVKKNSDSVELLHMAYQQSVFPYVNQHGKEQRIPLPVQSQETYQSILTPARMQLSSYSTGQSLNLQPRLGSGVALPSDLPSSFATPAAVHSTTDTLVHSNLLPPLPSGSLPASSHLLQNLSSSISGSPASALSGLISSLMAQGLISLNSHSQAQDSLGVDFNLDLLKVRHESVINSLYADLPRQCTTCGLRFKCQEEHSSHMDWHVTKNRISKNRKQKPSRKWFVSAKEWLSGAETLGNDVVPGFLPTESITEKKEDKDVAVPADENQKVCALCGETFEDFYSDEMEEWMYKGAVYLNAPDGYTEGLDRCQLGPIVHAKCRSESNESQQV